MIQVKCDKKYAKNLIVFIIYIIYSILIYILHIFQLKNPLFIKIPL